MAAGLHVGDTQPGHKQQRLAVQVDHAAVVLHGNLPVSAEFAEARGVDQQPDVGLFGFQQGFQFRKAGFFQQVQHDGTNRDACLGFQGFQSRRPAGDRPDFIHGNISAQLTDEFPPHAGAGSRDNGNVHMIAASLCVN